ncbi:hypothetical protein [Lysinibacillus sp. NPDC047702]
MRAINEWYALRQIVYKVCEDKKIQTTSTMTYFELFELVVPRLCASII